MRAPPSPAVSRRSLVARLVCALGAALILPEVAARPRRGKAPIGADDEAAITKAVQAEVERRAPGSRVGVEQITTARDYAFAMVTPRDATSAYQMVWLQRAAGWTVVLGPIIAAEEEALRAAGIPRALWPW